MFVLAFVKSKTGLKSWTWKDVLPYMIRNENQQDLNRLKSGIYGQNGPVYLQSLSSSSSKSSTSTNDQSIDDHSSVDRILQTFLHASRQSGYRIIDLNQGVSNGSSLLQSTIKQGRRQSISTAFLEPILKQRINLHVLANSMVTKILFENDRAIGVRFQRDWQQYSVFARQEVIISAGTLQSPKLLMLSGIGPRTELNRHQIPLKIDLPGVGENLHDHVGSLGMYFIVDSIPEPGITKQHLKQYFYYGKGPLARSSYAATIFRSRTKSFNNNDHNHYHQQQSSSPDSMLLTWINGLTNREISPELSEQQLNLKRSAWQQYYGEKLKTTQGKLQFTILPIVLKPKSRGTIRLKSSNIFDSPLIDPKYLEHPDDLRQLTDAMHETLRLIRTKSFRRLHTKWYQSVIPGCEYEYQKFQSEFAETILTDNNDNNNGDETIDSLSNDTIELIEEQPDNIFNTNAHSNHQQQPQSQSETTTAKILHQSQNANGQNLPFYFVSSFMNKLFRKSPTSLIRRRLENFRSSSSSLNDLNNRRHYHHRLWRRSTNSSSSSYYYDQYWILEPEQFKNHPLMNKTLYGGIDGSSSLIDGFSSSSSSNQNPDIGITVWNSHRQQSTRPKPSQQQQTITESTTKTLLSPQLPVNVEPIVLTGYFDSPPKISSYSSTESPSSTTTTTRTTTKRYQSYHFSTTKPPLPNRRFNNNNNNQSQQQQQQTVSNKKSNALDQYLRCIARQMTMPIGDYVGTCRMGTKNDHHNGGAVVDERFRVIGIRSLRIIDNSVIPEITTGSMGSVAIMLGERGAEFIREDRKKLMKKN